MFKPGGHEKLSMWFDPAFALALVLACLPTILSHDVVAMIITYYYTLVK